MANLLSCIHPSVENHLPVQSKEDVGVDVIIASLLYFFIIKNDGCGILDRIGAQGTIASR